MLSTLQQIFMFVTGLATGWCHSNPPTVAPVAKAPTCTPFTFRETDDPAIAFIWESCRQHYYTNTGPPDGMSFEDCVERGLQKRAISR